MHITDSQLTLESRHTLETRSFGSTTLERIGGTGEAQGVRRSFEDELNSLMAARLQDSTASELSCCRAPQQLHDILETMLAMLFGSRGAFPPAALAGNGDGMAALDPAALAAPPSRPHWQLTQAEQTSESESCEFSASGKVCLADGSERQFEVGFEFERSEESSRVVSRTLIDPLVIDRAGPRATLGGSVEFDLNQDGELEQMRLPDAGSAFLFLDRNHNGIADNGGELFGPETGNGFAELARLDGDGNGWIDEADAAYADLRLWQAAAAERPAVQRLDEAGIGALNTASAATPFALKEDGAQVGQMRSSGVWLGESGGAGMIRQIDVATTPLAASKA